MNSFGTWTGSRTKALTKIHVRPKRNLYRKLQQHPENHKQNVQRSGHDHSDMNTSTLNFLANEDDSEEEIVTFELSKVKNLRRGNSNLAAADQKSGRNALETNFVEKEIEAGDTLHNLALRYGCKLSEMKRINNLIADQEFYGLRRIKVPVKEHGFAKEQLEKENEMKMKHLMRSEVAKIEMDANGSSTTNGNTRLISIRDNGHAKEFLHQMDADLERIRKSTKTEKDTLEEVTLSLTCKRFHPFSELRPRGSIPTLRILILVIILALIAFPIIFFLLMIHSRTADASHINLTHDQRQDSSLLNK